ncbi:MAG TPA: FkbM family methyltransferase [Caulobacteraceae bacterium]|jgi:FkbM family methyltransferase
MSLAHTATLALKRAYYGSRGEPFRIAGQTLRFVPGSRPTRLRYANSPNRVNRFDALQTKLLAERLRPGDFALDVGANRGAVALVMAACVGRSGRVVAFEPDPVERAVLLRNTELNPRIEVTVETFAVSDHAGEAEFFSDGSNSSLQRTATSRPDAAGAVKVQMVTLDDYVGESSPPAWVKIDIEGAEIAALRGARRLLAGPTDFVVELHPYAWAAFGDRYDELRQLVAASGRRLRYLDEAHEIAGEPIYGTVALERV